MAVGRDQGEPRVVGIDLGTTNSVVAYLDNVGVPKSVVNFEGEIMTPSKLLIEDGNVVVGREAVKAARTHADGYAESFKRFLGEDAYPRQLAGCTWRPEELSALVLRRLIRDVRQRLGRLDAAVITVPAYFDECRRRATYAAAAIADCRVIDLINEPTAAAIAYAHRQGQSEDNGRGSERIFVFDLGGGTMDATILEVRRGNEYRTIATDGEVQLGGVDWDVRLCDYLAGQFRRQTGRDPLATAKGQIEFLQLAERAKRLLSKRGQVRLPCRLGRHRAVLEIDAGCFEDQTSDLLDRTRGTAELVLAQANLRWSDIETVLSVGGSSRMPMIQRMLRKLTGKEPDSSLSKDEGVAHGAAVYAQLTQGDGSVRVVNVTSHTYRVVAEREAGREPVAWPLIHKNSPLPATGKHVFRTARAGQRNCAIAICDGESEDPNDCIPIGQVVVDGLAEAGPKRWYVKVKLVCRQDGRLGVRATIHDPDSKAAVRRRSATIVPVQGMQPHEVEQARKRIQSINIS